MYFDDVRQEFFAAIGRLETDAGEKLRAAYNLAENEHQGQLRKQHKLRPSGEQDPYLIHPLRVCLILINELSLCDITSLTSAVLHDVVEDGNSNLNIVQIAELFDKNVAQAVDYLTKPAPEGSPLETKLALRAYHESFHSAPLHVRLIKLSDRLDNMREAVLVDYPKFQSRYLTETREIYMPLARQTSLFFSGQLQGLCSQLESLITCQT